MTGDNHHEGQPRPLVSLRATGGHMGPGTGPISTP